jgi:hypothetical protein
VFTQIERPIRIPVPEVGHGNIAAAIALQRLLQMNGIEDSEIWRLRFTAKAGQVLHRGMSHLPGVSRSYTNASEQVRRSLLARGFGQLLYRELAWHLNAFKNERKQAPSELNLMVIQEHQLFGLTQKMMNKLGSAYLLVPDVFPKASAKDIVRKWKDKIIFLVWNEDAYEELHREGLPVALVPPFLLAGFRPEEQSTTNRPEKKSDFYEEGVPVVLKSSGSGMPAAWVKQIQQVLQICPEYRMFLPRQVWENGSKHQFKQGEIENELDEFYQSLGGKTRVIISYPSEMTMVVQELRARGVPVIWICLPPRGEHEKRNLEYAFAHHLCTALLDFDLPPDFLPHILRITIPELREFLQQFVVDSR